MPSTLPVHLLIRFSDAFMKVDDTIDEHQSVIKKYGAAWLGKVGKPLAQRHADRLNAQIADGVPTYAILVQNVGRAGRADYRGYKGWVSEVSTRTPEDEQKLIPAYYEDQNITDTARLWVKLKRISAMEARDLSQFRIASSGMSLPQTLRSSMAAMFLIEEAAGDVH